MKRTYKYYDILDSTGLILLSGFETKETAETMMKVCNGSKIVERYETVCLSRENMAEMYGY